MERAQEAALNLACFAIFSLLFVGVYGGASLLYPHLPYHIALAPYEGAFWPSFSGLYLSLNLLIALAFARCRDLELAQLFSALCGQTLIAGVCFLAFPLQSFSPPWQPDTAAFQLADAINLEGNYLPSLHAAYAVTCAFFWRNGLSVLWSLGIVASTFLTHQHYPVDSLAGVLLALFVSVWVSGSKGRILAQCVSELLRCSLRHRRYGLIGSGLMATLLLRPRTGWRALVGFCFLQRLDDLLDGHLPTDTEPEELAKEQLDAWSRGQFKDDWLSCLGAELHRVLPETEDVQAVIQEMIIDRRRVRDRQLLSEDDLQSHLESTFQLSLSLMLKASGAELGPQHVPSLAPLLGWCSVVRDLEEDLDLGLVNVPKEVWQSGEHKVWFEAEHNKAKRLFSRSAEELGPLKGRSGYGLLRLFRDSVGKYIRQFEAGEAATKTLAYRSEWSEENG